MPPIALTAGQLADDAERLAPVSGCRCRDCGANAHRRPPAEKWAVVHGAAYCPECTLEILPPRVRQDTTTGLWLCEVWSPIGRYIVQTERSTEAEALADVPSFAEV